ncbi:MAG: HEPN domain-containing protein [bacterium]
MQKHNHWLLKAKSDLNLAKKGLSGEPNTLDSAIYHTQQCAEKILKAYLVLLVGDIPIKTHDLTLLLALCKKHDEGFDLLNKDVAVLNPYATEFRYPDDFINIPEKFVVEDAIFRAEKILNFVKEKISEIEMGQKNIFNR